MNRLFFTLALTAVTLGGCKVDEINENDTIAPGGDTTLRAVIEDGNPKVAFTDDGVFSWTGSEAISVYTDAGSFVRFDLTAGGGTSSATFTGMLGEAKTDKVAVYPYSDAHALSGKALTFNLPSEYPWSSDRNVNAPMLAKLETGGESLSFRHTGGLVMVRFTDVPDEARKFVFSVDGYKICGDFTIADITADDAVLTTAESTEGNSVSLTFATPAKEMTFFIPAPTGSYPGFRVELRDAAGSTLVARNRAKAFSIARRDMARMGSIDGETFNGRKLLFDFGHKNDSNCPPTTSPDNNGNYWNNIEKNSSGQNGQGLTFDLVYSNNDPTPYKLTLVTNFWSNGSANGGLTEAKWSATTSTSLGDLAVGTATQDYFFAQGADMVCTFQLSGLDITKGYRFKFFGSRAAQNDSQTREAKYTVNGNNSFEGLLLITGPGNNVQNTDDILTSSVIYPKADGTATVSISRGSNTQTSNHYYQLNCMKVEEIEGGLIPVSYDFNSLEVTSAEETFLMHRANTNGYVFEGVSTFSAGEVDLKAGTSDGREINLKADCNVDGLAYLVADLDNMDFSFTAISDVLAEGSALNGWSNTNGATLTYQGNGVFSGTNLTFAGTNYNSKTAVSDPARFNFLFKGSWSPTFQRLNGTRREIEASTYNNSGAIQINPGVYDVTLNLRDFTFDVAASAIDPDRITVMGSSVPRGIGATDNYGYMWMFNDILAARGNWYLSNISVSGNNTLNLLERYDELVTDGAPYVIYALSLGNEGIHEASDKTAIYNQWKTNMQTLISQARADGKTVVVTGNYARADFDDADYTAVKNMNMEIHEWDMPSVNLLGAIDDGQGRWAAGYDAGDTYHPNTAGHTELSYTIVPSLFDALKAGKALPTRIDGGSKTLSGRQVIALEPENRIHPFTISFGVKTSAAGAILTFFDGETAKNISVTDAGVLSYGGATGATTVADGAWHQVTLTHFYARGETLLYVDGILQCSVSEKVITTAFYVGYAAADTSASWREIFFWRSGMNAQEIAAISDGKMLKSSLEIYAPLSGGSLENKAQSTNTLSLADGSTLVPAEDTTPRLNGEPLTESAGSLSIPVISLTQGSTLTLSNVPGAVSDYWWDPDYFTVSGSTVTFNPVSGYYGFSIYTGTEKYVSAWRVTENGNKANLEQGGLYVAGYGIAGYKMADEIGWAGNNMYCLAEITPGVFQITGVAVVERDPDVQGGKFRYDYWSVKYFFQSGWGGEASKGVSISGGAASSLKQGSDGNLGLNSNLELGGTYRMKIDFTGATISGASVTSGTETVIFDKL